MKSNMGLTENSRKRIAKMLSTLLSDTFILYIKVQGFHWNVKGPFFENQYKELGQSIDNIAERLRALGEPAPSSCKDFLRHAHLEEIEGNTGTSSMVNLLLYDHESIAHWIRKYLPELTEMNDAVTIDLFVKRLEFHEKSSWVLRSCG
jgi:starvation-inducible DNA-binding protein